MIAMSPHAMPNSPRPSPRTFGSSARSASLADVAALAGVSTGTVSRALSKPEMISEATRARVMAAADRLGYVVNGAARALAMRRTKTIGAVVPRFGSSSFPAMIQALQATLAEQGYTLLLSAPEGRGEQELGILRAMLERGVDAVALLGTDQPPAILSMLAANRTPFVQMWAPPGSGSDAVGFDEHAAGAQVVAHLAALGHKRIGFVGGHSRDSERARHRFEGVALALARHDMALDERAIIETEYGFAEGFAAMREILARRTPVTAMVFGTDYLAAGALAALDQGGIAVPQALSVASFNDNDFAAYLHPPLTTVRLPIREIGEAAGRLLLARLAGEHFEPPALQVELIVRASTGPA
ncbi:LacI family DNA-binding transcriptional regulator [Variovorax sp. RA8]|uniref:LacI family DNA-binding transcriptional regulator n=1 Tax=Variovorax sp. (strain JCM 16519 / RA8) TaxID=662548 RepID=UPI00131662E4|nr:LacI family DNA-binding transcriptional regulator [Variovorax sp. RA8]VTU19486.1 HTH-type transcriptional repressor CytR [Variovorax sp. RA8]